jgi:hypothetical protein
MAPAGDVQRGLLQEWYVSPLSRVQIEAYLRKPPPDSDGQALSAADLSSFVAASPYLNEVINTPFLLRVFCSAYPQLAARRNRSTDITRSDIYAAFMQAWFEKERKKLADSTGLPQTDVDQASHRALRLRCSSTRSTR